MGVAPVNVPVDEGEILEGKYRIDGLIGAGSMGSVVAAWHLDLEKRVAIKFLHPEIAAREQAVGRFLREARAVVRINSEHVARVFDVGRLPRGEPYIVMEYLDGRDMALALQQQGTLSVVDAVRYVQQVCEALAEAHTAGVIHRDLKPANLFLDTRDGVPRVKVLDFGISKMPISEDKAALLTNTTAVMGSPAYMSPEQLRSTHNVDEKTDIWALGVILYEMLTGKLPFDATTLPQMCTMILHTEPKAPRAHRWDLPAGLEAVIMRCLEKDQAARFANVAELSAALVPFGPSGAGASAARAARSQRLPSPWGQTIEPTVDPSAIVSFRPKRSRGWILAGLTIGLVGLIAFAVRTTQTAADGAAAAGGAAARGPEAGVPLDAVVGGTKAPEPRPNDNGTTLPNAATSGDPASAQAQPRPESSATAGRPRKGPKPKSETPTPPAKTHATQPAPPEPTNREPPADDFGGRK